MTSIDRAFDVLRQEGPLVFIKKVYRRALNVMLIGNPEEHRMVLSSIKDETRTQTMIDVGAATGNALAPFVAAGWRVHAFEPDPRNLATLHRMYGHHENVNINSSAVSDRADKAVTFYTSDLSLGMSSLAAFDPSHRPSTVVDTTTLRSYMGDCGLSTVDFLKIDTEGADLLVLQGYPWDVGNPRVVMCEFEDSKSRHFGYTWEDLAKILTDRGYWVLVSEWHPLDQYGHGHRWRRFEAYPCNLADPSAWGNLIAAEDEHLFGKLLSEFADYEERREQLKPIRRLLGG